MSERSAVERLVRAGGEHAFRGFGMATAPVRPAPEFIGIGGKRCGSTSFHFGLLQHPSVLPLFPSADRLPMKEHRKWVRALATPEPSAVWYRSHFPSGFARRSHGNVFGPAVTGETTPWYLFAEGAAERAAKLAPDAMILAVLREPAVRAWSHFKEQRRRGHEPLTDFAEALDAEHDRRMRGLVGADTRSADFATEHLTYRLQGEYAKGLRPWIERFERVLVLRSEDFYADAPAALNEAAVFLGVGPHAFTAEQRNATAPTSDPPVEVMAELRRHYAPLNEELEALLGRPFGW